MRKQLFAEKKKIIVAAALLLIAAYAFYVNRNISIKALYMDDLYMWSCYGEQSIWEFVFPFRTSTRFRPVYWLLTYLEMLAVGTAVPQFVTVNILWNLLAAFLLFAFCKKVSGSVLCSFAASVVFLSSRFAYYQIGQVLGLMETLALILSLLVLYFLFCFQKESEERMLSGDGALCVSLRKERYFLFALLFWFLVCFTHERFLCLFPLFYLSLFFEILKTERSRRKIYISEKRRLFLAPLCLLLLILFLRFLFIGNVVPAGTGGTEVTETFSLPQMLRFFLSEVLYLFGINDGPDYLCGMQYGETPQIIRRIIKFSVLMAAILLLSFFLAFLKSSGHPAKDAEKRLRYLSDAGLFGGFIFCCLLASSCTIRVEMRWIYAPFAALLVFLCELTAEAGRELTGETETAEEAGTPPQKGRAALRKVLPAVFLLFSVFSIIPNLFYRGTFPNLYFWSDQQRVNHIAEETVEKYGRDAVLGKQVYLLDSTVEMSDFYCRTFFKPFDPEKTGQGTRLRLIESVEEITEYPCIVLREDPSGGTFTEITAELPVNGGTAN